MNTKGGGRGGLGKRLSESYISLTMSPFRHSATIHHNVANKMIEFCPTLKTYHNTCSFARSTKVAALYKRRD